MNTEVNPSIDNIVSEEDILGTFDKNHKGHTGNCVKVLTDRGLLPLSYDSERMKDLNILASWVFYSGAILRGRGYLKRVVVSPGEHSDEVSDLIGRLGFEPQPDSSGRNAISVTMHGSCLGRLLYRMGLPLGKKSENGLRIPEYLINSPDNVLARDSILVLYKAKRTIRRKCYLFTIRNKDTAERLGSDIVFLFKRAGFPVPEFSATYDTSKDKYRVALHFPKLLSHIRSF